MTQSKSSILSRWAAVAAFCLATSAGFADQTWKGTTDNQWTTTGNWSGGAIPGSSDLVAYNANSTGNLSNWLSQAFSIAGINFTNPASSVSINSASTLTCGAGGINMSNATQTLSINAPVALGANQVWVVTNTGTLTVSGGVSGGFWLYKDGFGSLVLNGANSFTGNFTNNGGAVWINNSAGLGAGAKSIAIANNNFGAGLHLNGTNGNISFPANFSFTVSDDKGTIINEAGDNTVNGPMSEITGGGQAYMVVNAGTLTLNGAITLGTTGRPIEFGGAGNGTNNGVVSGAGFSVRKIDAGAWTFNANNTYAGYTTVEAGTMVLGPSAKIGNTTNITVFSNAILDVSGATNSAGSNTLFLAANQVLAGGGLVKGSINAGAAGALIQPGSLNVAQTAGGMGAAGTLTISSNLTMGATTTNYFELSPLTTPGGGANDLIVVGGDLDPQNARISIATLNGLANGTYQLISYTGSKLSSFNPTVLNPSSLRGTFTIDESVAGQINLVVSGVVNPVWSGTGSSSTWDLNTTADWNGNTLTFFAGDAVTFDDTGTASTVNLSGTLQPGAVTFNNSAVNYTVASTGKITGLTGLTKSGSGTLTISASANDFTGPVTINGGILSVGTFSPSGVASPLGAGSSIVLNGGTFQFTGARPTAGAVNRSWTLGANGGTVQSTTATFFISNTISGPGSFTKSGSQQLIIGDLTAGLLTAGSNTYSGNTYITQGELQFRNAHAFGSGKVVITTGADLAVGGQTNYGIMTNNIDLNGPDTGALGTIEIGDNNTAINLGGTLTLLGNGSVGSKSGASGLTFNISGPIVGSGSFTKLQSSAMTCTLGGTNTYTGNTIITGGTLAVGIGGAGAISNSANISVGAGAKLQLNAGATLGSTVNISLAAGAYMDVNGLGAGSTYTLGSGATLNASGTGTTSGTTQAEIHGNATGTVSLGSQPVSLTFTPTAFTGDTAHPPLVISQGTLQLNNNIITINNAAGTALGAGTYRVIQVGNGTTGSISGTPNATPFISGKGLAAGNTATLSVSSGNVNLVVASTSPTATTTTLNSLTSSTYGSSVTLTATVSPTPTGGTVQFYDNGVAIGAPVAVSSGAASYTTALLWAGNHPITAAYSGTSGFGASATASASTQTVNPTALSITANNDSKTYGQSKTYGAGSAAFTSSGLKNGDAISSVTLIASGGTAANAAAGSYNLTPTNAVGGAFNANNYTITYNTGSLTVNPAALSITATADSKTYGQAKAYGAGSTAFTSSGLQNGETIGSVTITASSGSAATDAVGTYSLTPSAAIGGTFTAANYTITYNAGNLAVNPAALSITATADSKTYGQAKAYGAGSTAFTSSGLQNGETIGSVTITASGGTSATDPVGAYNITPSAATGGTFNTANYTITYHNGTLSVIQAVPVVNLTSSSNPSGFGDSLVFTAALPSDATGSVVFQTNGAAFSTNTLVSGSANSASVGNLPRGTNQIMAVYSGDANYLAGTNTLAQIVTNHPPVANLVTIARTAGINSFKIALSDLATNWSDVDGDAVSFVSAAASTNGAMVATNGGYLLYYNTNFVADQLSYTVADGFGGTNTGLVNIVVGSNPLFGQTSPSIDTTGGAPSITFAGIPGYSYSIMRSTDMITWTAIGTTNAPAGGVFQFTDNSAPQPTAFYRLQYNP